MKIYGIFLTLSIKITYFLKNLSHINEISLNNWKKSAILPLMDNYQPFEVCENVKPAGNNPLRFSLEISNDTTPVLFTEETRQEDEGQEMCSRIFKAYPHKTMIFITHRDTVCKMCDEIVKL